MLDVKPHVAYGYFAEQPSETLQLCWQGEKKAGQVGCWASGEAGGSSKDPD